MPVAKGEYWMSRDRRNTYCIYVVDPNGWDAGCLDADDWEAVFLPYDCRCRYEYHRKSPWRGHMQIAGFKTAQRKLKELNSQGDWLTSDGVERRPVYAMQKIQRLPRWKRRWKKRP